MSNTALLGSYGGQGNSSLMFRNKVINGAMEICQRYAVNTNVTLGAPAYVVDRFVAREATPASANAQWSTVAPDGFANSLAYLITATGTPTTNDIAGIEHKIEGLNVVDLAWGTAAAKPVALSFWARSSVTGTYGGLVTNGAETRAYGYTYSISAANTWEYKTVVIPGDTSGTWLKDNGIGLRITWDMGSGSGKRVAGGSWSTISNFEFGVNSTVILGQTASASFYITGVQLEAETATPFERRPYSVEEQMCFRYFQKITQMLALNQLNSLNELCIWYKPVVPMRTSATATVALANADYIANVPTGNQWTLYRPGIGYSTKTGTLIWSFEPGTPPVDGNLATSSGATFSGGGNNKISATGTSGIYLNAEL